MPTVAGTDSMPQPKTRKYAVGAIPDADLAFLEASGVIASIAVAADGTISSANGRMRRFLGLADPLACSGERLTDYLVDPNAWDAWCDAARQGRTIEVELRGFDGPTKLFRGDVLMAGEGADRRFVGLLVDGADHKALRRNTVRAWRLSAA
jgi:PAS domain-containing protein